MANTLLLLTILLFSFKTKSSEKIIGAAVNYVDSTYHFDTIKINDQQFIRTSKNNTFNCLTTLKGDTIIRSEEFWINNEILDIDEDGYQDIRVFVRSSTPNQCDNYLYDKKLKTFALLDNCDLDIHKIKGTKYFYSYNSVGCSDMNWESYLSQIDNFRLTSLGYMYGQGCDFNIKENPQIISIYIITHDDNRTIIETLSYPKQIPRFEDKWHFIQRYWTEHHQKFIR